MKTPMTVKVAVIIPCYKVRTHILSVIKSIGPEVERIFVVDDCCPEQSGRYVEEHCQEERVSVIRNPQNLGVGGAVMRGYEAAIAEGWDILVKIDGDGQMDAELISYFIAPIASGEADYTKGNRFFYLDSIKNMPKIRVFGNAVLSLITKLSSGYWDLFDPTNGYTAIHRDVARHLLPKKISNRYFFETDMLFRLNIMRAVVVDVPMDARYGDEISNLKIRKIVHEFLFKHMVNLGKRIFYNYYLRDMSIASIELPLGIFLFAFGVAYGSIHWLSSMHAGKPTPAGTVMLAALPILLGFQFILGFIGHDIASVPRRPIHRSGRLRPRTHIAVKEH
jgi:glycosyltransferase involved in cell wall biosynthesis